MEVKPVAISEAKKRADAKWSKANRKSAACMLTNAEHAAFKSWAEARGLTVSGALLEYVRKCITETESAANMEQNNGTEQKSAAD
jgi:hypothetical protein